MNTTQLQKILTERAYNPQDEPENENVVFRIQFQNIGSLGNFILVTGTPKAGKSKWISGMNAAALKRQDVFSLNIRLPDDKRRIAHWDTEQNRYDYHAMMKLIKKLANIDVFPENYHSFHCRQDNARTIMAMVEYFLQQNPDTGMIFLDGLLDMIDRFNDEGQSKQLVNFLKRITDVHNVLVVGVLHRSVSVNKSIGHLGSSADRAAQSVLIVEKNKEVKQYVLRAEYLRSADDFEPLAIWYNKDCQTWEQCDYIPTEETPRGANRKRRPHEYDITEHLDNIRRIFNSDRVLSYGNYINAICEIYALGHNLAKDMGAYLVKEGLVFRIEQGYTNQRQKGLFVERKN